MADEAPAADEVFQTEPPPEILSFALLRAYEDVREDRTHANRGADEASTRAQLKFAINSRTWRNSWLLQVVLTDLQWQRIGLEEGDWDLWWCAGRATNRALRELRPHQRVNKFPDSSTLTLKANLFATYARARARHGARGFGLFMPETYVLPADLDAFEAARAALDGAADSIWIVKPYAAYCGRGIFLLRNAAAVPPAVLEERAVVSRYLAQPYLIGGIKSDIRLYVLVTCWHPLTVYAYANGLVRFATDAYSLDDADLDNRTAHITNYTLNKRSSNFVPTGALDADGTGSKWTLDALRARLVADVGEAAAAAAWRAVDELLVQTCVAAEPAMLAAYEHNVPEPVRAQPHACCFQLFGFDVMFDARLKPWLLEVNLDPALGTDSPLDFKVKSAMLVDALNLLGINGATTAHGHARARPPTHAEEARARLPADELRKWRALAQANGELERSRKGGWRRLAPAADDSGYAPFFEPGRDLNKLPFDF